jgi:hypothetical protein
MYSSKLATYLRTPVAATKRHTANPALPNNGTTKNTYPPKRQTYVEEDVDGLIGAGDKVADCYPLDRGDVGIMRHHEVDFVQQGDECHLLGLELALLVR